MESLVIQRDNQAVTTSLDIAGTFGKNHNNVMRDIRGLLKNEHTQQMFDKSTYVNPQNHQEYPMYYMNRDGFSLLVMGFTGKKALEFKLKYINAFNKMEDYIKKGDRLESTSNFKSAYIEMMRQQNENKAHQLRNDDVHLMLKLADVAEKYSRDHMAMEFRNEAIKSMMALPAGGIREYSATEIADIIGVKPLVIGKWANKLRIKGDHSLSYKSSADSWRYFPRALEIFQAHKLEIQADEIENFLD